MHYPKDAEKLGIEGQVIVSFVVETDGAITNVEVTQKVFPSLDADAARVVRSMPRWIPATKQGTPIRVRYRLPISFKIPK